MDRELEFLWHECEDARQLIGISATRINGRLAGFLVEMTADDDRAGRFYYTLTVLYLGVEKELQSGRFRVDGEIPEAAKAHEAELVRYCQQWIAEQDGA